LILIVMAFVTHILYSRTKFGKYIYAIGGNEQAARVSGINVGRYKILIYTYAGMLSGLAGLVVSSRIGSGQPGLGVGYELDGIAAAVIGGTSLSAGGIGTIPGTIVGALIIGVLNNTSTSSTSRPTGSRSSRAGSSSAPWSSTSARTEEIDEPS